MRQRAAFTTMQRRHTMRSFLPAIFAALAPFAIAACVQFVPALNPLNRWAQGNDAIFGGCIVALCMPFAFVLWNRVNVRNVTR
jgi:hypothetical protein